jgi:ElaA protein
MVSKFKTYEALTKDELYQILHLRNEVFVVEQACPYQDIDGKDLDAYHLLMFDDQQLIGYLRILKPGTSYEEASIGRVIIKKSHRDKRLGRVLMQESIDFVQNELNLQTLRISAQCYLEKFYTSLGFARVSEDYMEDDIPHLEMLLTIALV